MPNQPRDDNPHRSVRVHDDDWADLATTAESHNLDRAKVINALIRWYLRRAGATLPAGSPSDPSSELEA